jgi:Bacterial Ig-like domain (group 2)
MKKFLTFSLQIFPRNVFAFVALFSITLITSCEQQDIFTNNELDKPVASIRITPAESAVSVSDTIQFSAIATLEDGKIKDITDSVTWTYSGSGTLTATSTPGRYTALFSGSAYVTATAGSIVSSSSNGDATLIITAGDFYVSPSGSNITGTGTSMNPFATIDHAMSLASAGINIRIAAGNYTTSQITLIEGVSLLGGYSAADWSRDIINQRAQITDSSTSGGIIGSQIPKATITGSSLITQATIIEGLDVSGSNNPGMAISAPIDTNLGSPTIRYCAFTGGFGTDSSYGMYINGGSPTIEFVSINGGNAPTTMGIKIASPNSTALITSSRIDAGLGTSNIGIAVYNISGGSVKIYNNIILCGSSPSSTFATSISTYSAPIIANNTFLINTATTSAKGVITAYSSGRPYIYNNIFMFFPGTNRYGIYENSYAGDSPNAVRNNIFYNATTVYHDNDSSSDWDIAGMENVSTGAQFNGGTISNGNSVINPNLSSDGTYRLTAASPAIAASGGLDGTTLGWPGFPTDIFGNAIDFIRNTRTAGAWSMGAYQYPQL